MKHRSYTVKLRYAAGYTRNTAGSPWDYYHNAIKDRDVHFTDDKTIVAAWIERRTTERAGKVRTR